MITEAGSAGEQPGLLQRLFENAALDPISGELGKSIVFCASQRLALKVTQLLNQLASARWPGRYRSGFAVQATSLAPGTQQMTFNFSNSQLIGTGARFVRTAA